MCGIAGIFAPRLPPAELERRVRAMSAAQAFRGPDGEGAWVGPGVALAAARLRVVGGAVEGGQPFPDRWGGRTVFNGEVYEHRAILRELGEEAPESAGDGVALASLLALRGPAGLAGVRAMFAAARYDRASDSLLLLRDALGKKPLYLRRVAGGWAFASTLAAIHAGTGPLEVRPAALHEYAVFRSVGGVRSAFAGVEQVPPGSWARLRRDGGTATGRWWAPPEVDAGAAGRPAEVRRAVEASVAARAAPGHELGVFLSGGLDSAVVAATAVERPSDRGVRLYTVGYDVPGREDERRFSRALAAWLGAPAEDLEVRGADVPALMEAVAEATEEPIADPVTVPTLVLSRAAARRTKTVLTGDGSDEVWGGYARFDEPAASLGDYLERTMTFSPRELGLDRPPASYLEGVGLPAERPPGLDGIMRLEVANRLRNYHLARVDKITMASGLEARLPFLDVRVVGLGLSLRATEKRPRGRPKGLLADAFRERLPGWLLARRKQPFSAPVGEWLRGPLRELARDALLAPAARTAGLVAAAPYLRDLEPGCPGAEARAARAWALLQLELWLRTFARRVALRPAA